MMAVYKREVRSYFNSMIGYVFTAIIVLFISAFFFLSAGHPYFATALSSASFIFVLSIPILTMRSMAEERKSKTDQMLLTYPVKVSSIIMGKYFALVTVFAVPLLISCLFPIVISFNAVGSFLIDYSTILAFLCLGSAFIAVGMFISSLTESQVIAAVGTLAALLMLFFLPSISYIIPETASASVIGFAVILVLILLLLYRLTRSNIMTAVVGILGVGALAAGYFLDKAFLAGLLRKVLGSFSVGDVTSNFASYYVFDVKGLLLLLSVAALFVFLTVQTVQRRRWS
jgi:ABC-2 type transport system permease protein